MVRRSGGRVTPKGTVPDGVKPKNLRRKGFLGAAASVRENLGNAQSSLEEERVTGESAGGLVSVTLSGSGEPLAVHVDPKAVDPSDNTLLEDLLLAAMVDAAEKVGALRGSVLGAATEGLELGPLAALLGA